MDKPTASEILRDIVSGDVDLDAIAELIRSSEFVIRTYQTELEGLRRNEERLKDDFCREKQAVDDLARRLAQIYEENRLARSVFQAEIEGKREILGILSNVDLEALSMEKLIQEREAVQQQLGKLLERQNGTVFNRRQSAAGRTG
ncbi:MAG: hypothetical protein ABH878_02740 [bacterium]